MRNTTAPRSLHLLAIAAAVAALALHAGFVPAALAQTAATVVKSVEDVKGLLAPTILPGALEISAAAASAKVGETITIRGNIPEGAGGIEGAAGAGTFSLGSARFTLIEAQAPTAPAGAESDKKPAPAPAPASAPPSATIRILNHKGELLQGSLRGQHGLKPGAEVFVTGKVESAGASLVLSAVSMHVPRDPLPPGFFTAAPIAAAPGAPTAPAPRDVSEARKAGGLKVGDEVVLRGRIGGSKEPFVPGRAVFTLMGRGLKACSENPGDNCSKPWDYCCEAQADILANSVTVQVVGAKSQVLRTDLKGRRGIKELSEIVVIGKVASADGKAVVINATGMMVP